MKIFAFQNIVGLYQRIKSHFDCKHYQSELNWSEDLKCHISGVPGSQGQMDFSRTDNMCSRADSVGPDSLIIHCSLLEIR